MNGLEYVDFHFVYSANTPLVWRVAGVYARDGDSAIVLQNQSTGQVIRWNLVGFTYDSWASFTPPTPVRRCRHPRVGTWSACGRSPATTHPP